MGIGDVETVIRIEVHIVGSVLMIGAEMTQKRQTIRIENCDPVVIDIGDEELLAVRRKLNVVRIRECRGNRAKEFNTEGIRHSRTE